MAVEMRKQFPKLYRRINVERNDAWVPKLVERLESPGTDDTLRNMRWRLEAVCQLHPLGAVVMEILERLQRESNDNVYLRFKQRHTREKTRWWD